MEEGGCCTEEKLGGRGKSLRLQPVLPAGISTQKFQQWQKMCNNGRTGVEAQTLESSKDEY